MRWSCLILQASGLTVIASGSSNLSHPYRPSSINSNLSIPSTQPLCNANADLLRITDRPEPPTTTIQLRRGRLAPACQLCAGLPPLHQKRQCLINRQLPPHKILPPAHSWCAISQEQGRARCIGDAEARRRT